MSDLFHEDVPDEFIDKVFAVMAMCHDHTFQVLTKRAERMRDYLCSWPTLPGSLASNRVQWRDRDVHKWIKTDQFNGRFIGTLWPLPNVWLGVSVEDQHCLIDRWEFLRSTPAAVRFFSAEPLLGPLNMTPVFDCMTKPDWVIVGGESGPGARPCNIAWIRSIVKQCEDADVRCFVKQLGSRPIQDGASRGDYRESDDCRVLWQMKDKKGGDPAEWPEDLRGVREFPVERPLNLEDA